MKKIEIIVLLAALSGCATTQPWEREFLAKPVMQTNADARRGAIEGHYRSTREGATGGFGGGGGGCGCN